MLTPIQFKEKTNTHPAFLSNVRFSKNATNLAIAKINDYYKPLTHSHIPVLRINEYNSKKAPSNILQEFINSFKKLTDEKNLGGSFHFFKSKKDRGHFLIKYTSDDNKNLSTTFKFNAYDIIPEDTNGQNPFIDSTNLILAETADSLANMGLGYGKENPLNTFSTPAKELHYRIKELKNKNSVLLSR